MPGVRYHSTIVKRVLLNAAAVLSPVLCVAVALLWVRSYFATESLRHSAPTTWQGVVVGRGGMLYLRATRIAEPLKPEPWKRKVDPVTSDVVHEQWLVKDFFRFAGFARGVPAIAW